MTIKSFFLRLLSLFVSERKPRQQATRIQELVELYRTFRLESLNDVFLSDRSISRVMVIEKRITAYRKLLAECIDCMHNDTAIPMHYVGKDAEEILRRDFFTSERNVYVDPVKEATEFINNAIMFLELYELLEEKEEKSFNTQKNIYTVQKITANLMTLIHEL
jgi:hypothetical protein